MQEIFIFLSDSTAGAITTTPPSGAGKAVTRVGEAATTTDFATHIEPPVLLDNGSVKLDLEPYAANVEGLVAALLDFKDTIT